MVDHHGKRWRELATLPARPKAVSRHAGDPRPKGEDQRYEYQRGIVALAAAGAAHTPTYPSDAHAW